MSPSIYKILAPAAINVLCALLSLVGPFISTSLGALAYRMFFVSGLIVYVGSLYRSGLLSFSKASEILTSSDGPFLVFFVTFLILPHNSFAILVPQTILSVLVCSYLVSLPGALNDSMPPIVKSLSTSINQQATAYVIQAAALEAINGFILVPLTCPLITTVAYWFFLRLRYVENNNVRHAYLLLRRQIEGLADHPSCPAIVKTVVHKFTNAVATLAPRPAAAPSPARK